VREGTPPGRGEADRGVDRVLPEPLVDETRRTICDRLIEAAEGQDRFEVQHHADGAQLVAETGGDLLVDGIVLNDALEGEAPVAGRADAVRSEVPAGLIEEARRGARIVAATGFDGGIVELAAGRQRAAGWGAVAE